jgi:serine/threonine protein kinase
MAFQLLVTAGPDKDKIFTVQPGINLMLGRNPQCHYQLNDPSVSRAHCQVLLDGEQVTVIDNNSSSGTHVNNKKVARQTIKLGDVIKVGNSELSLQMGDFPLQAAMGGVHAASTPAVSPAHPKVDQLASLVGKTLSHFEIHHVLGQGHTSMVFFANDTQHGNRPVALKVLLPEFSKNDEEMQRFIRAMKTMLPLRHPNLIALYGAGKTGAYCWSAMEYVAGETLTQVIQRIGVAGMLDWRNAFQVAVDVGRALEYAHGNQIIHRNVTPENILRQATDKVSKLGDLLLAKALEGSLAQQITRPGELVGDVAYMSPERTRGTTDLDGRSDLYGLGATVYALLTGRPPFEGTTLIEKITRIRQDEPIKPSKFQMSIPHPFEGVVLKLLAKRPEDRFQNAQAMLKELGRIAKLHGLPF